MIEVTFIYLGALAVLIFLMIRIAKDWKDDDFPPPVL